MPKLIDYPRTNYTGAWELAEVVDDTGGKSAIETAARKLNRKVSGSFKAIIGSAVKFGLMTSKRELLSTTTLFKRIKHAYDKQEELQFHREAFLTPPLFTQICRKFRGRELPVQMLDVMLIREFGVEEINAQSVAKAFVEGCRMCSLLDEHNIMADIDALNAQRATRRELASPIPSTNTFTQNNHTIYSSSNDAAAASLYDILTSAPTKKKEELNLSTDTDDKPIEHTNNQIKSNQNHSEGDTIANLFGLTNSVREEHISNEVTPELERILPPVSQFTSNEASKVIPAMHHQNSNNPSSSLQNINYQISIAGPGVNTSLDVTHEEDISIAIALLEKIRRQLRTNQ